jgi:3-isopropylmalate/(R)-2-methylmalate dehydratase small subunit
MPALDKVTGVAAPILKDNISTDTIAPMFRRATTGGGRQFAHSEEDQAKQAFANWRWDAHDNPLPDFILNRPPYDKARFILAGANFACGSSRETAVTYLRAFGVRCVVAPSFGGIFYDNCFRNAMLPLIQAREIVERLAALSQNGAVFALDVTAGTLTAPDGTVISFDLPSFRREALLSGADEVAVTLRRADEIARWQETTRQLRPWAYPTPRSSPS